MAGPEPAGPAAELPAGQPTWLLLHGPFDPSVGPLLQHLRERLARSGAPGQVRALSLPVLLGVLPWRLWLDASGTRCQLGDGSWANEAVRGVINRLPDPWPAPGQADADYVAAEWRALLCAWLQGLSLQGVPVLNRARPDALCGGGLSDTVWRVRAAQAGLPVVDWAGVAGGPPAAGPPGGWAPGQLMAADPPAAGSPPDLLLVGRRCLRAPASALAAAWPVAWERPLRRLAAQAQCALLGVQLAWAEAAAPGQPPRPVFHAAQACPPLEPWGAAAWAALADAVALPGAMRPVPQRSAAAGHPAARPTARA